MGIRKLRASRSLTLSALLVKLMGLGPDGATKNRLTGLIGAASRFGLAEESVAGLLGAKA